MPRHPYPGSVMRPRPAPPHPDYDPIIAPSRRGGDYEFERGTGFELESGRAPAATPSSPTLASTPRIKALTVVAKSFINCIGGNVGFTPCIARTVPVPLGLPIPSNLALRALAKATDLAFCENPTTPVMDKRYRLFSQMTYVAQCTPAGLNVVPKPIITDTGKEGPLQAPALTVRSQFLRRISAMVFEFGWLGLGRPHNLAEPPFQVVCPRMSRYIWHEVRGRIACTPSGPVVIAFLQGSKFPTHRLWVDGVARSSIPQRYFGDLWWPTPGEPTRVRELEEPPSPHRTA